VSIYVKMCQREVDTYNKILFLIARRVQ